MKTLTTTPSPSQQLYRVAFRARWKFTPDFRPPTTLPRRSRAGPTEATLVSGAPEIRGSRERQPRYP